MPSDERVWLYVDGESSPEEAREIERAMEEDGALAARVEECRAIRAGVLDGAPEPPDDFADKVMTAVRERRARAGTVVDLMDLRRFLRRAVAAAAVLAVVGLVLWLAETGPNLFGDEDVHAIPDPIGGRR